MSANQQVLAGLGKPKSQEEFTTQGTYSFVVPSGVTSISTVTIGGGGCTLFGGNRGGGGALSYVNNIAVTPGETLTVTVGAPGYYLPGMGVVDGSESSLKRGSTVLCSAAAALGSIGGSTGVGTVFAGGNSTGGDDSQSQYAGGGGAAGYSGKGGDGGYLSATDGAGGGGGGGIDGCGGGGTGIYGQGPNGAKGSEYGYQGGGGGSGGTAGTTGTSTPRNHGGSFGGGAGRYVITSLFAGGGAVRIIWPGNLRQFPSTRTADE